MLRGFTDSTGVEWKVCAVLPNKSSDPSDGELSRSSLKDTAFANGWLCFESSLEKRRLARSGYHEQERYLERTDNRPK